MPAWLVPSQSNRAAEPPDSGGVGGHLLEPGAGLRALNGDHRPLGGDVLDGDIAVGLLSQGADHPPRVGCVGHDVELPGLEPPHDDVVGHRPIVRVEVGVLGPAGLDLAEVVGERPLKRVVLPAPDTRTVPRWLTSKATAPSQHAVLGEVPCS